MMTSCGCSAWLSARLDIRWISSGESMQGSPFYGDFGGRQIGILILEWSLRLHNHNLLPAHRRKTLQKVLLRSEFPDCAMSLPISLDRMNYNIDDACIFYFASQNPGSQPTRPTSSCSAKSNVGYLRVRSQPWYMISQSASQHRITTIKPTGDISERARCCDAGSWRCG